MLVKLEAYHDGEYWCARGIGEAEVPTGSVDPSMSDGLPYRQEVRAMFRLPNRGEEYEQHRERRLLQDEYEREARTGRPSLFRRRQVTLQEAIILLLLVVVLGAVILLLLEVLAPR